MRISSDQISLKDAVCFVVDNRGKSAPTAEQGHALIATNCISNDDLYPTYKNVRYVSEETFQNWFRAHPKPGDIILTNKGSQNGAICLVPEVVDFCIAQDMMALRAHPERIDSLYLFAALRSAPIQQAIKNLNVDGVIPHFKKTDFDKLVIPLPDRRIQILIGKLHFSLVEKIELNRKMNATLESMARALFRDWFVDFGPTRAKMAGTAPYLSTGLWSLFPERLDEDGMPEGWEVGALSDLATLNPESWTARNAPDTVAYVDLANTKWGSIDKVEHYAWADAPSRARRILRGGDTIVGTVRPGNGSFCYVGEDGMTGSTGFAVLRPKSPRDRAFVWCASTSAENIDRLAHLADGGAYPAIRPDAVAATDVVIPSADVLEAFRNAVSASLDLMDANKTESRTLAQTRDLLLPRLMSGELLVAEAEGIIKEVA